MLPGLPLGAADAAGVAVSATQRSGWSAYRRNTADSQRADPNHKHHAANVLHTDARPRGLGEALPQDCLSGMVTAQSVNAATRWR
jgi:hypothetical protein